MLQTWEPCNNDKIQIGDTWEFQCRAFKSLSKVEQNQAEAKWEHHDMKKTKSKANPKIEAKQSPGVNRNKVHGLKTSKKKSFQNHEANQQKQDQDIGHKLLSLNH